MLTAQRIEITAHVVYHKKANKGVRLAILQFMM
jgi:hypothetical protein